VTKQFPIDGECKNCGAAKALANGDTLCETCREMVVLDDFGAYQSREDMFRAD
jgi:hypothetical protein